MEITPASTDETDTIVDMWVDLARDQQAYGSHLCGADNRAVIRERILQRIVTDNLLLAREDQSILGFVMVTVEHGRYEQTVVRGVVENLYVRPAYRRKGLGTALLRAGEKRLAEQGATVVGIKTLAGNDDARRFYATHGYTPHRIELERSIENDTP